ncbi:MAG: 50S ribosomal protein L21 [Gemmatimonadota bacterium]
MYAIFRALGKQYRAERDATLRLPSLDAEPGDTVRFDDVLLAADDGDVQVGTPTLDGASVAVEVVRHGRDDKIVVYKMKRRKGYRKKQGHRQEFTEVRIVEIGFGGKGGKKATKAEPKAKKAEPKAKPERKTAPKAEKAPKAEVAPDEAPDAEAIDVTDVARELAEEHGIDLASLEGTGKDGRILKSDVEKAIREQEGE